MSKGDSYFKALKVIDSCSTQEQFFNASKFLDNYYKVHIEKVKEYSERRAALDLYEILLNKFNERFNEIVE